ncbi:hypothetical protein FSP39_009070 [Pinctada imbricata]|uniref:Sigma non-opioid intracellular receptor 1 n=1 Tax=Pinctada imbricata TaxID=66713 RepID=A0AA88YQN1_PINIB|nr:hypothetical protein FSP39_009070 [Pinctada imbricata]
MCSFVTLFHLAKWIVCICFLIFCIQYWLYKKEFLSSEEEIAVLSKKFVGKDPKLAYQKIHRELQRRYPGHILEESDLQWIFMNAGGWMGSICILHASVTEYILFFGTAIDTSGHSGRYWANISDTILSGSFRQWKEGELESRMFYPGDTVFHELGEVTAVQWEAGTWMVEYARGFIPSTLGFALADTFFSTTDVVTLYYILRVYTKALVYEMGASLEDWRQYIKDNL